MPNRVRIAAKDIAEAILEITGDALVKGDFDAFASVFHVPQYMATMAGPVYMESVEDMRRAFDDMHAYFKGAGIDELNRKVTEAHYVSDTSIESTHLSEVVAADGASIGTYPVFSVLEKIDGVWKVARSEYCLEPDTAEATAIAKADTSARKDNE